MRKICVIYNPAARSGRSRSVLHALSVESKGCALWPTQRPRHAELLARRAVEEGYETVVAAGGDGTLNEVVNGMMSAAILGSSEGVGTALPALGVLPLGTVNVFARQLRLPMHPRAAWEVIERGHRREVDVLRANDRWFTQMAGVGLDARIVAVTSLGLKRIVGFWAYVAAGVFEAARPQPRLVARADGREVTGRAVLVGNGQRYAGWFSMWPRARLDDGRFEVCVWEGEGVPAALHFALRALYGRHCSMNNVHCFSTRRLRVEAVEGEAMVELEGEVAGITPVEFTLQPRGLRVISG